MANYRGRGGKRGPGSRVNTGRKGAVGLGPTPSNTFTTMMARRMKGMRGSGVVRDSGSSSHMYYSVHPSGFGGPRGRSSNRITH